MSIYTIQGQDVEFDPFDVEAYERYESQLEQMRKIKEEIPTGSAATARRPVNSSPSSRSRKPWITF